MRTRHIVPALALAALLVAGVALPGVAATWHTERAAPLAAASPDDAPPARLTSAGLGGGPARIDPVLARQLEQVGPDDRLDVLVHADDIATAERALAHTGVAPVTSFERIGVAVGAGTPDGIRALRHADGVVYLEANRPLDFDLDTSHEATRGGEARTAFLPADEPPHPGTRGRCRELDNPNIPDRDEGCPPPTFDEQVGGSGVSVAVVDSGIDGTHPFFELPDGSSKVVRNMRVVVASCPVFFTQDQGIPCSGDNTTFFSTVEDVPGNDTDHMAGGGHGTHVAGIAAGVDTDVPELETSLHGAAPDARLIGLGTGAGISIIGSVQALEWVLENHEQPCGPDVAAAACPPIKVVNNSYGATNSGSDGYNPDSATAKIQDEVVAEGVVMVWAAGNGDATNDGGDGSDVRVNVPAQSPTPGIIGVANYNDQNSGTRDGSLSSSSSRGRDGSRATYPDISAPGSSITSSCRRTLTCGAHGANPDYGTIGGTSMAAPHVAGIVAQLFQVDPTLTPADVEDVLEDSAYKFTFGATYEADLADRNADSTTSFDKGHGLVDVKAAVAHLLGITIDDVPPPACASGPVVIDEEGDNPHPRTGARYPGTDLLAASVEASATGDSFVVTLDVADLVEEYPDGGTGTFWDLNFNIGATDIFVAAARDLVDPPATDAERFFIGRARATLETLTEGLDGSLDVDNDLIAITVTQADFDAANTDIERRNAQPGAVVEPTLPAIADGLVLSDFVLTARESTYLGAGNLVTQVDSGAGICSYQHGTGVVSSSVKAKGDPPPPPEPPDPEDYDEELSSTTSPVRWNGAAAVPAYPTASAGGCLGPSDPLCENFRIYVSEAGDLTVTVGFPPDDDWDIYLRGPGGAVVDDAATAANPEVITFPVVTPGVYTVSALPFLTPAGTFDAVATLTP